jgi:DNA-binding HxlR family transcriptional regulator
MPDEPTPTGPFKPSFLAATELIGKRWTAAIVWAIYHGHNRFGDLQNNSRPKKSLNATCTPKHQCASNTN